MSDDKSAATVTETTMVAGSALVPVTATAICLLARKAGFASNDAGLHGGV